MSAEENRVEIENQEHRLNLIKQKIVASMRHRTGPKYRIIHSKDKPALYYFKCPNRRGWIVIRSSHYGIPYGAFEIPPKFDAHYFVNVNKKKKEEYPKNIHEMNQHSARDLNMRYLPRENVKKQISMVPFEQMMEWANEGPEKIYQEMNFIF